MSILDKIKGGIKKNGAKGKITAINLYWKDTAHSMEGVDIDSKIVTVTVPFTNHSNTSELSFLKTTEKSETVTDISTTDPFSIDSIDPKLPIDIKPGEHVDFKINLKAPNYNYNGPLTLKFSSPKNKDDLIELNINKIMLKNGEKEVDLEDTRYFTNFAKNQIFDISVQMYRILKYKSKVEKVELNEPFKLVKLDTELPFTIDDHSSFVVTLSIQGPDFNYSGPLEINFT